MQKLTGTQLRLLRQLKNLGQKEIATMTGMSQQRVSAIEKSVKVTEDSCNRILLALKLTEEEAIRLLKNLLPSEGVKF